MSFFADCLKCCGASIIALILLAATLGISVASVVLGATNLNSNCTGISQLPAYLITAGVLGIVVVLLRASELDSEDKDEKPKKESLFVQLLQLGQVCVLIWGSVILFGVERPVCDRVLFDYAFAITMTAYAFLALVILIACCGIGITSCQACINHCCGDGEDELTCECSCCGKLHSADDAAKEKTEPNRATEVVIDIPRIGIIQRVDKLQNDIDTDC